MKPRDPSLKGTLNKRLNRVEGQIRGIKGMIEKDAYCNDIIIQVSAARAALDSIGRLLMENHLKSCLVRKIRDGEDEVINELLKTIDKMTR